MINGLAVFITIYVNSIAFDAIGWKLYIVYCGWLALEVIIVWNVFIETKGRTLEELAILFDGDQAPLVIEKIRQIEELARADVQNGENNEYA